MSAKLIRAAYTEERVEYHRSFEWNGDPHGSGYEFPCDKDGNVDVDALNEAGKANYLGCVSGDFNVTDEGVKVYEWSYRHRAVVECGNCKGHIHLTNFTNPCDCGADYNMSGQRLTNRRSWGEETGEHWTECV